jgi:hypothetical protein
VRRILAVGGTVAAVVVLVAAPADAARAIVAPVAGDVACGLSGTMTFNKPLPNASLDGVARTIHVKVTAKISDCVNTAVTGGKAPITGGKLTITGILEEGASCADLTGAAPPDFTFDPNKLDVKWSGTSANGGHPTVGHGKTDVFSTGDTLLGGWEYLTDSFGDKDAFAGESATIDLLLDSSKDVNACSRGLNDPATGSPVNLKSVSFSAQNGSMIEVTP